VDAGHAISFMNKYYKTIGADGKQKFFRKGTKGLVIKAFDGALFFSVDEQLCALEEIPVRATASHEFDQDPKPAKPKKPYIPEMSHPWKRNSFDKFANGQKHRADLAPAS
jgi:hypothetical protein